MCVCPRYQQSVFFCGLGGLTTQTERPDRKRRRPPRTNSAASSVSGARALPERAIREGSETGERDGGRGRKEGWCDVGIEGTAWVLSPSQGHPNRQEAPFPSAYPPPATPPPAISTSLPLEKFIFPSFSPSSLLPPPLCAFSLSHLQRYFLASRSVTIRAKQQEIYTSNNNILTQKFKTCRCKLIANCSGVFLLLV